MKLIVGLGNPGSRYQKTRHNVGQWMGDKIRNSKSEIRKVKLHKTNIFMNESGIEVKKVVSDLDIRVSDLLVVHDDLDLTPGQWKIQFNRSSAGHKGVQSIIDELGTQEFWRLRIGIGRVPVDKTANQFVVEKPTKEELELIERAIAECLPRILEWGDAL